MFRYLPSFSLQFPLLPCFQRKMLEWKIELQSKKILLVSSDSTLDILLNLNSQKLKVLLQTTKGLRYRSILPGNSLTHNISLIFLVQFMKNCSHFSLEVAVQRERRNRTLFTFLLNLKCLKYCLEFRTLCKDSLGHLHGKLNKKAFKFVWITFCWSFITEIVLDLWNCSAKECAKSLFLMNNSLELRLLCYEP